MLSISDANKVQRKVSTRKGVGLSEATLIDRLRENSLMLGLPISMPN